MRGIMLSVLSHAAEIGIFFGAAAVLALGTVGLR